MLSDTPFHAVDFAGVPGWQDPCQCLCVVVCRSVRSPLCGFEPALSSARVLGKDKTDWRLGLRVCRCRWRWVHDTRQECGLHRRGIISGSRVVPPKPPAMSMRRLADCAADQCRHATCRAHAIASCASPQRCVANVARACSRLLSCTRLRKSITSSRGHRCDSAKRNASGGQAFGVAQGLRPDEEARCESVAARAGRRCGGRPAARSFCRRRGGCRMHGGAPPRRHTAEVACTLRRQDPAPGASGAV